jgi:hypothetical protein
MISKALTPGTEQQKSPSGLSRAMARQTMIDLHYAPTPNGWKISIMLEELMACSIGGTKTMCPSSASATRVVSLFY